MRQRGWLPARHADMILAVMMVDAAPNQNKLNDGDPLARMIGEVAVLDTDTPILYVGRLTEITACAFVLAEADMHDCRDGHANKELYLAESAQHGVAMNRRQIVVMRSCVISVSLLSDVVAE